MVELVEQYFFITLAEQKCVGVHILEVRWSALGVHWSALNVK